MALFKETFESLGRRGLWKAAPQSQGCGFESGYEPKQSSILIVFAWPAFEHWSFYIMYKSLEQ